MADLDSKDSKTAASESLPTPVQMSHRRPPSPCDQTANLFALPRNMSVVSRRFGGLSGMRVIVDPSLQIPKSLVKDNSYSDPPVANLELSVTFGAVDANIKVLPFPAGTVLAREPHRPWDMTESNFNKGLQVHLRSHSTTGNITLRVDSALAPIFVDASSTFGQLRIYLPRTFHGPLNLWSWSRKPRFSVELSRACRPMSEDGSMMRWFVGDVAAWTSNGEFGDKAKVETTFGDIWVGYVGEKDESARAFRSVWMHWVINVASVVLILWGIYVVPELLWRFVKWAFRVFYLIPSMFLNLF
ncbi:hypothetical protein C8R43DRAFT_923182 [Mycena crocata]|nr:hypothetical protein C8R43DRAFT_923182 [Mycena crocata]